tara:strand:+ start:110700 stop:111491 length:792 start_codon:yes stop_codon:yes gene_type:complete
MQTKRLIPLLLLFLCLASCENKENSNMEPAVEYDAADEADSKEMDLAALKSKILQESKSSIEYAEDKKDNHYGYTSTTDWDILKEEGDSLLIGNTAPTKREELGGRRTVVTLFKGDESEGRIVPGTDTLELKENAQNLNVYNLQPKLVVMNNDTVVYGIGYSVHYVFNKIKDDLDKSDLANIAASAQIDPDETKATYSILTYGIESEDADIMPHQNKTFNVKEYGDLQAQIASLRYVLGDSTNMAKLKFSPEKIPGLTAKDFE